VRRPHGGGETGLLTGGPRVSAEEREGDGCMTDGPIEKKFNYFEIFKFVQS
jgi:hypothetical protein